MKTENAVKKLEKNGFKIQIISNKIIARKGENEITFIDQMGSVRAIFSSNEAQRNEHSPETDYFAKIHHNTISQAIKFLG